jgi:hypothetical protein
MKNFGIKIHKNTKIGDPLLDFLATPSTLLKRIFPKSQGPPPPSGFPTTVNLWQQLKSVTKLKDLMIIGFNHDSRLVD